MTPSSPFRPDPDAFVDYFGRITGRHVLVVGDLMLDHYIWGDANRISPEAPVPVVQVQRDSYAGGGAANVALNLAAIGVRTWLAGVIGTDHAGNILKGILSRSGVNTLPDLSPFSGARMTIEKTRVLVRNQQLCRIDRESAPHHYRLDLESTRREIEALAPKFDGVILSDYGKGAITREIAVLFRDYCRARKIPLAYDPKPSRLAPIEEADLLTPNRTEAYQLAGLPPHRPGEPEDLENLAERIQERFAPSHLIITLGSEGMIHYENGHRIQHFPTYAREVFDVSGAGDTVIATLLAATMIGLAPSQAIPLANCAAGVVVAKVGTATATPDEIVAFAARHPRTQREG